MRTEEEIKRAVREKYSNVARQGCCPDDACTAAEFERSRGYSLEQLSTVPEEADLGLGCGNPTALAPIEPGMTVLDLGSGAGIDAFLAAAKVGPKGKVIGVDMTESMIEEARKNARRSNIQNVEFRLGEIENLPVEDESIDLIISNCVINLSPNKDKVFSEAYRVLHRGGRMQISDVVTRGTTPEEMRRSAELWAGCVSGALDKEVYLEKLRRAGFNRVEIVKEFEYDLPQLFTPSKSGLWKSFLRWKTFGSWKALSPRGLAGLAHLFRAHRNNHFGVVSVSLVATK
jgi:ubiquinone/menaquinone biosynthesis C-methylase UbiE